MVGHWQFWPRAGVRLPCAAQWGRGEAAARTATNGMPCSQKMTAPFTTTRKTWQCSQGKWGPVHSPKVIPLPPGGRSPCAERGDRRHHEGSTEGHQVCMGAWSVFALIQGKIPHKNLCSAPTSFPLNGLVSERASWHKPGVRRGLRACTPGPAPCEDSLHHHPTRRAPAGSL